MKWRRMSQMRGGRVRGPPLLLLLQGACGFLSDHPLASITHTHRGKRVSERAKKTAALTKLCRNGRGETEAETGEEKSRRANKATKLRSGPNQGSTKSRWPDPAV